jgi:PIN domain nuclease of toxin-antitoxin system
MRVLLDTHVLLWSLGSGRDLGKEATRIILNEPEVYVSAVSIWESVIKQAVGKLTIPKGFESAIRRNNFLELPLRWQHAALSGNIKLPHRDPFDKVLLSQAKQEQLMLLTADQILLKVYPNICIDAKI